MKHRNYKKIWILWNIINSVSYLYLLCTTVATLVSRSVICFIRGELRAQFQDSLVAHAGVSRRAGGDQLPAVWAALCFWLCSAMCSADSIWHWAALNSAHSPVVFSAHTGSAGRAERRRGAAREDAWDSARLPSACPRGCPNSALRSC